jgi:hypothetical protein
MIQMSSLSGEDSVIGTSPLHSSAGFNQKLDLQMTSIASIYLAWRRLPLYAGIAYDTLAGIATGYGLDSQGVAFRVTVRAVGTGGSRYSDWLRGWTAKGSQFESR